MWQPIVVLLAVLMSQAYTAPQFITFNDGKLGVNFGGYHAAVGIGGLAGGNGGAGGGLYAEAGTPHGQGARVGLGGSTNGNGVSNGGLYAGATAGGNINAQAGLSGAVNGDKTNGLGFASAQSGGYGASSGLVGDKLALAQRKEERRRLKEAKKALKKAQRRQQGGSSSGNGAAGFTYSGTNSFGVVKEKEVSIKPVEVKPVHKKPHKEFNFDATNEVNFVPLKSDVATDVKLEAAVPAVSVKEVHVEAPQVVEKHTVQTYYKPRHHLKNNAYLGGFFGADVAPSVVYKQPALEKRIDVGVEEGANVGASASASGKVGGGTQGVYTKEVFVQRNPNFFADIFNIPISTLKAVGSFLGNTAASTSVSVQKTASVQGDSDSISSKHVPLTSTSSSDTEISVQTPTVSKVIDDIFAIPINTLSAVNKFLENNVPARKRVQVSQEGGEGIAKRQARFGPRRRANKQAQSAVETDNSEN